MSEYVIGAANILGGLFLHSLTAGRLSRSEEAREYWSTWRARHPAFSQYGPPFLVAYGLVRIAFGLLS